ncbi:flippase [Enterocloster bolteae]|jgi:O-antigen/teichoic acid export membrane protein|uniref:Flippase n=1 Tax=Enterocloster bolteae TaxID=208479 RepID=A0A412YT04_9FIRM|nr:flippase [Enterocloster bolteae]RGQ56235.1 flippase [Enterocloster bolteae]RGS01891.1 flippase [Enterocloster bolteae]RGV68710.1 flippase [Enterocloster bolteae]
MRKRHSLTYNGVMNLIYTGSRIFFPLLTAPFLARTLGPASTGRVDFIISIANYFVLIASLGIPTYGIRICAEAGNDKTILSRTVHELLFINVTATIISLFLYTLCILVTPRLFSEYPIAILGGILILFRTFSIDWFYQGIEQYDYITTRTLIMRLLAMVFIFLAIHSPKDYLAYGISCLIMETGASICNFWNLRKYILLTKINGYHIKAHFKPIIIFFLSSVAISVYNQIDVTMIGMLQSSSEVGFYEYGIKPVKVIWTVLIGLTSVAMPRVVSLIKQHRKQEERLLRRKAAQGIFLLSVPIVVFLFSISESLILFLFGPGYATSVTVFKIFVFAITPVAYSNYLANIILLPNGKEKERAFSVNIGLIVDIILNTFLIPHYGAAGAAFATLCTELAVCLCLLCSSRKELKDAFVDFNWRKKISIVVVCITLGLLTKWLPISNLFLKIIASVIIYGLGYLSTLLSFREPVFMEQKIKIIEALHKKFR